METGNFLPLGRCMVGVAPCLAALERVVGGLDLVVYTLPEEAMGVFSMAPSYEFESPSSTVDFYSRRLEDTWHSDFLNIEQVDASVTVLARLDSGTISLYKKSGSFDLVAENKGMYSSFDVEHLIVSMHVALLKEQTVSALLSAWYHGALPHKSCYVGQGISGPAVGHNVIAPANITNEIFTDAVFCDASTFRNKVSRTMLDSLKSREKLGWWSFLPINIFAFESKHQATQQCLEKSIREVSAVTPNLAIVQYLAQSGACLARRKIAGR